MRPRPVQSVRRLLPSTLIISHLTCVSQVVVALKDELPTVGVFVSNNKMSDNLSTNNPICMTFGLNERNHP